MTTDSKEVNPLDVEVRIIIEKTLEIDVSKLDSEANLFQKAGIDSMGMLEIVAGVEQKFKIRIHEKDFAKIASVRSIVDLIGAYSTIA